MTRDELIAALEAATGPSRELDWWVWWYGKSTEATAPNPRPPGEEYIRDSLEANNSPRYTASIDAALTLVPKGWMVELWTAQPTDTERWNSRVAAYYHPNHKYYGENAYTAIALCIAALKARTE